MRIGFYTPNYPAVNGEGGIGSYTRDVAHGLKELGHEVVIVTLGKGEPILDGTLPIYSVDPRPIKGVDRIFPGAGACWRIGGLMNQLTKKHQLDIVEFPNWEGYGLYYQRLGRTPTVVRFHTSSKETQLIDSLPKSRYLEWDIYRERWQTFQASALVTHSDAHRNMMAEEMGISTSQIHLIPHGVPVYPHWQRPAKVNPDPTVVFLGRMEKRKGTWELLQAIPKVLQQVPQAKFVFIGSDRRHCPGDRTHAEYIAQELPESVRQQITLAGRLPQTEVDHWLQTADLFVAPSRYESFGLVFLEAMRWGTPVLGTTAGGIPEIITHGQTGWLVPPENPDALADGLIELLTNADRRNHLGQQGRACVESRFTVQSMAKAVEEFFLSVLTNRVKKRSRSPKENQPVEMSR